MQKLLLCLFTLVLGFSGFCLFFFSQQIVDFAFTSV